MQIKSKKRRKQDLNWIFETCPWNFDDSSVPLLIDKVG